MKFDPELAAKQEAAVEYMLRPESDGAALLAFDMGLGKTRTSLMYAKASGARCVLVVVPLQTMEDWEKTAREIYPLLPVKIIKTDVALKPGQKPTPKNQAGKRAYSDFQWRADGIYLITHQLWEGRAWKPELVKKKRKTDPDRYRKVDSGAWSGGNFLFIFDESHRTANWDSWTNRACMNLTPFHEGGPFKLALSGTFMGDRFDGAFGATRWMWPHRTDIIPANIFDWRALWAEIAYDRFAPRNQKTVGEKVPGAFVSALPCYIREEANVPDAVVHEILVDLYDEQRRIYDELDEKMVTWINEYPLVAEYSITKRARQRQTTLAVPTLEFVVQPDGEAKLDVSFEDDAESVKADTLFREIDGEGELGDLMVNEPLLILTDSQKFARILTARLNTRYGGAKEWSGKVTKPQRKKVKAAFIAGELRFIVGIQSAMGTGTDGLQYTDARIVVFMSRADRRIDNEQGVSRLNRTGQEQIVHEVRIIARNTVDTGQLSKQMEQAIKRAKEMRAAERKRIREEQRERFAQHQASLRGS